jgi:hypothetical protein
MFTKSHQGIVKNTIVLEFENGYSITLEKGVEMAMFLAMPEERLAKRAVDLPCCCAEIESAGVVNPDCPRHVSIRANH